MMRFYMHYHELIHDHTEFKTETSKRQRDINVWGSKEKPELMI
jgi:hypothetical protein